MIGARAAVLVVVALTCAGCLGSYDAPTSSSGTAATGSCADAPVDSLNSPSLTNPPAKFAGTGSVRMSPEHPVLTPGTPVVLNATFTNPDCRTFFFRDPWGECVGSVFSIGDEPLNWFTNQRSFEFNWLFTHSCGFGLAAPYLAVPPGETYSRSFSWNGSVDLWDHGSIETGTEWAKRTYWAAPGDWPLRYGLPQGSYETRKDDVIRVEANALNAASPLVFGACNTGYRPDELRIENATLAVSRPEAVIGSEVRVHLNYTLVVPKAGCYIFAGEPNVRAAKTPTEQGISLGHTCTGSLNSADLFRVLVNASSPLVHAHVVYHWDGRSESDLDAPFAGCRSPASAGNYTLDFVAGGGFGGWPRLTSKVEIPFRWLPA